MTAPTPTVPAGTLLAVFAHPDDETFLAGALLAHLTARGVAVDLVCLTPEDGPPGSQAAVRRHELACAAAVLGLRAVHVLGYREQELATVGVAELSGRVYEMAAALRPEALLTDAPYGAYGHAHHILAHRAAVAAGAALTLAGRPTPVYALAYPAALVRAYFRLVKWGGLERRLAAGRNDLNLAQALAQQRPPDLRVRLTGPAVATRKRAAACHQSQLSSALLPLRALEAAPVWAQAALFGTALLTRELPGEGDPAWLA